MENYKYELVHHGTKGMKWGVRRYQNTDGSLTPAGKKRYQNADGSLNEKGKEFYRQRDKERREEARANVSSGSKAGSTMLARKEMKDRISEIELKKRYDELTYEPSTLEKSKDVVDATADTVNRLKTLERNTRPKDTIIKMDLTSMSDQQMRNEINRALLERQYNEMFAPRKSHRGREIAGKVLEVGGGILAVGSTALSIAVAIKKLKE